ncbi:MAG: hypothetical protein JST00_22470 [Deltaproteobacteria bacterium]|nr:hypothetical protein [Deltaproteobacteria bacterium]
MKIDIRCLAGVRLDAREKAIAKQRIWSCLDHHSTALERARFTLSDENGPRGGRDLRCVAELKLVHGGTVIAETRTDDPLVSVTSAAACAERALDRRLALSRQVRSHKLAHAS